jgi:6-phosphogluconolactonase
LVNASGEAACPRKILWTVTAQETFMVIKLLPDAGAAVQEAAAHIAADARASIAARGRFIAAFSGGHTPLAMLRALAEEDIPWDGVSIVQVDERVAPAEEPERNLTGLREGLLEHAPLRPEQIYAMPVEASDLRAGAMAYALTLSRIAGSPPVLDLVHLGLGADGHTASLVPGDPVLRIADADVALTGIYRGRRRMTLTYPVINRSRRILWLVTGAEKAGMLARLIEGDMSIPAGLVNRSRAVVLADQTAAPNL